MFIRTRELTSPSLMIQQNASARAQIYAYIDGQPFLNNWRLLMMHWIVQGRVENSSYNCVPGAN